jgi:polysaccharide export outer membrane protein
LDNAKRALKAGELQVAAVFTEQALQADPGLKAAAAFKAQPLRRAQERAAELDRRQLIRTYYQEGLRVLAEKDTGRALEHFQAALALDPTNRKIFNLIQRTYEIQHQLQTKRREQDFRTRLRTAGAGELEAEAIEDTLTGDGFPAPTSPSATLKAEAPTPAEPGEELASEAAASPPAPVEPGPGVVEAATYISVPHPPGEAAEATEQLASALPAEPAQALPAPSVPAALDQAASSLPEEISPGHGGGAPGVAHSATEEAAPAPQTVAQSDATGEYTIQPEDVLKITVFEEPDLTTTARVTSAGEIIFPLLGRVSVVGLTVTQVQERLTALLAADYLVNPQVQVFLDTTANPRRVFITGAVNRPGSYTISAERQTTIMEAIAMAGGFSKEAAVNKTRIVRVENGIEKTINVRISDIVKKGDKTQDVGVRPNDIIFVPESFF